MEAEMVGTIVLLAHNQECVVLQEAPILIA